MIPLKDSMPSQRTPLVNHVLIAGCTLAFILQLLAGEDGQTLVEQYGMVPARLTDRATPPVIEQAIPVRTPLGVVIARQQRALAPAAVPPLMTLLTCMFLHGGWMHFLGRSAGRRRAIGRRVT